MGRTPDSVVTYEKLNPESRTHRKSPASVLKTEAGESRWYHDTIVLGKEFL
jgi:hypothetical protein